jgi:hypothetical protein
MLCKFGLHRWQKKTTYRPGTSVYRCSSCNKRITLHRDRRRQQKRHALLGVVCASLAARFIIINVGKTGHTKVLHASGKVVGKVERAGSKVRSKIHSLEGDEGYTTNRQEMAP